MKKQHIYKIMIASSMALVVAAPTLTLSSCAKISQYTMPIITGGVNIANGPFSAIPNASLAAVNPQGSNPTGTSVYNSYLPSQYNTFMDVATGGQPNAYSYSSPDNVNSMPNTYDYNWYSYADSKLSYSKGDGKIASYKNLDIGNLSSAISSTVCDNASLLNTMFSFLNQPSILASPSSAMSWLQAMFPQVDLTNFFGADPTTDQQVNFYSFLFSLLNVLDEGKQSIKFDISNSNFKYDSWMYGPGPLIDQAHINQTNTASTDKFDMLPLDMPSNPVDAPTLTETYVQYAKKTTTSPASTSYIPSLMPYGMPVLMNLDNTTYSYYNPTSNHGINVDDWLIKNLNTVQNRVNSSNAWDAMNKLVSGHIDQKAPTLAYDIHSPTPASPISSFDSDLITTFTQDSGFDDSKPLECGWKNFFPISAPRTALAPNSFIGIAQYGISQYNAPPASNDVGSTQYNPVFLGFSSIFPTWLLYKPDGTVDQSLFTSHIIASQAGLKDIPDAQKKYAAYFDDAKLQKKMNKMLDFFKTYIHAGQLPGNLTETQQYYLGLFKRLFATYTDQTTATITSSNWIGIH